MNKPTKKPNVNNPKKQQKNVEKAKPTKKPNYAKKFNILYPIFVAWYTTPSELRDDGLKTEGEWAKKHETTYELVRKIKRSPNFAKDVVEKYNAERDERTFLVRQKLFDQILKDGESKAIKLYFEYEEKWSQKITNELVYNPQTVGEAMLLAKQELLNPKEDNEDKEEE